MKADSKGPDFSREHDARARDLWPVAGVDEAGRGPWAGPVAAAAVILDPDNIPDGLNDSKKLTEARREDLYLEILATATCACVLGTVEQIDRDNILATTMWAMTEAVNGLDPAPRLVLVDGNRLPPFACAAQAVIKGDALSLSIAAASIVAKVTRDRVMADLAEQFPAYGWDRNKGYGTREHADALTSLGVTPHHRRSFKPVNALL